MEKRKMMTGMMQGLLTGYSITMILLLILAGIMLKFWPDSQKMGLSILAVYVTANLAGGWVCGKKIRQKRFLCGLLEGVLYFLILLLISGMRSGHLPFDGGRTAVTAFLCAGSAMAGGIISGV